LKERDIIMDMWQLISLMAFGLALLNIGLQIGYELGYNHAKKEKSVDEMEERIKR